MSAHRPAIQIAARRMSSVNSIQHTNCLHCRVVLCALLLSALSTAIGIIMMQVIYSIGSVCSREEADSFNRSFFFSFRHTCGVVCWLSSLPAVHLPVSDNDRSVIIVLSFLFSFLSQSGSIGINLLLFQLLWWYLTRPLRWGGLPGGGGGRSRYPIERSAIRTLWCGATVARRKLPLMFPCMLLLLW